MNCAELYLLGRKLLEVGIRGLPEDSVLRRITPAARLVLEDASRYPGTSAAEVAERTGLPTDQVTLLATAMAAKGFAETLEGPDGIRITASRAVLFRENTVSPADKALAAALGTTDAAEASEVAGILESLAWRLSSGVASRTADHFDDAYRETPQWDTGRPQPALTELVEAGEVRGRVLDVGCGTGEHALMAAALGLPAMGIDVSRAAIEIAKRKAAGRGLPARFSVHDALDLAALGEQFDTVIDSALFHAFGDGDRLRYAAGLRRVVPAGGRYFMLCWSDRQPEGWGPRRVRREDIEALFADGWRIDEIAPVILEVTVDPAGVQAWRTALTRL